MATPEPAELFRLDAVPPLDGPVLVLALDGFIDAGGGRRLAREHLLKEFGPRQVGSFDHDLLYDYRARRPPMLFVEDHWESYADPVLALHLLHDTTGAPFLVLAGPEPDVLWERFAAAVQIVVERLGIRLTVVLNAIPMAVPHTRPVGVIAHGSRKALVASYEPWVASVQVPASAGHLVEYRLGEAGHDAVGFAVHVPHYVAQLDYPAAAEVLVQSIASVSGLVLPTAALAEAAAETRQAIDTYVQGEPEVAEVVRAVEQQYDAFVAGRRQGRLGDESQLPNADDLGAELERFLAEQSRRDRGDPRG